MEEYEEEFPVEIEKFRDGYIVIYCGDEVYFDTREEAIKFAKSL